MRPLFITGLLLAFASFALSQSPSQTLKRAEKALGGAKQFQAIASIQRTGRITRISDGANGRYILNTSRPNLLNEDLDLNGFEVERGFNGRSAWERNSRDGLQTLTGNSSLSLQAKAAFLNSLWLNYKADKSKIVAAGKASVSGKDTNVVILTPAQNISTKLFFDTSSGLLVRTETLDESIDLDDYRDVGSVRLAHAYRIKRGDAVYEVKLDDIKLNPTIARSEFDFPSIASQPLPDLTQLLADVQANEDKVEGLLDTYSFTQKSTRRALGKDGVLRDTESDTYQLSFYKGYRIRRMIEKNGQPLSKGDQEDADKDAAKQVAEIEKEISKSEKKSANGPPSEEGKGVSIAEVLRASKLAAPRRERFRDRDVIVFDFEPNPNFDYKNAKSMLKFFGKTAGVIWIDEKDKQVARVEAFLVDSFNVGGGVLAKLKKGATFTLEQSRVNDEIWLPSQADINLSMRVLMLKGIDVNQVIRSYDYHKFVTEVKDAAVKDVVKP
ncbi:MAG: hypothetical protein ABI878_03800 [Acidobacteriota bacterium]